MKPIYHDGTDIIIRLTEVEAIRLTAVINREVKGLPDPEADAAGQLEDALKDLMA